MKMDVVLTAAQFRRFTWFDLFRRRKIWRSPALFALILSVCAGVCFWMHQVRGAVLLGGVLLGVGLGLPCVYFASFAFSLRRQTAGLKEPQFVYSLDFSSPEEIRVSNQKETVRYPWKSVHHLYRDAGASYLYITPARAFILPDSCLQGQTPEQLWTLLTSRLPAGRCNWN